MEGKVLILTCSTGEGHNSAAHAVEAELAARGIGCDVVDILDFRSEKAGRRTAILYSFAIGKTPHLFGCVYSLGRAYDHLRLPSPLYQSGVHSAEKLYRFLCANDYFCVFCTHIFAMEAMTAVRRNFFLPVRCYGVITDYTIHPFVKDTDLDGYFVSSRNVAEQFLRLGFGRDRVFETGIPVHPKFLTRLEKREARAALSLPEESKLVLVMTGGSGCGKVKRLCARLLKNLHGSNIVVLTGRNGKLRAALKKFPSDRLRAEAFTPAVPLYLAAADCVISKSGGLSSTEIAATGVPLVHLKAVPGLETANAKYFARNGFSLRADSVRGAVKKAERLLFDGAASEQMRRAQAAVHPFGAKLIADKLTEGVYDDNSLGPVSFGRFPLGQCTVQQDHTQSAGA